MALNALDAFVADQQQPISRPEAIRVILMKFFRSKVTRPKRGTYLAPSSGWGHSVVVSQLDAQTYRERAGQCLALAERAQRDDDKATWLELAGKWQRLAEEAASRGQQAQQPEPRAGSKRFP